MEIRLAQPAEAVAVTACVRAAYAPYVARIGREPAPMQADYAELIEHGFVYVMPDPAAGVCAVLVLEQHEHTLWIINVAVHPGYQKRGLGRQLMAFAEQRARAATLSELRLYTHELMFENIALYGRLGYEEVDRREDEGFRRVFMRKLLP